MELDKINSLIVTNYDYFLSICKRIYYPNSKDNAEDLLNNAIVKIIENKDKFEEGTNFKAWFSIILRNIFINNYRSKNSCICVDNLSLLDNRLTPYYSVDEIFGEKDIREQFNSLSQHQKDCLYLYSKGFKYKEIAQMLNLQLGTVKSRIFLGREKLENKLNYINKDYDKEGNRKNL